MSTCSKQNVVLPHDAVLPALLLPRLLPPDLFLLVSALHASTILWPTTDGEIKSLNLSSIYVLHNCL